LATYVRRVEFGENSYFHYCLFIWQNDRCSLQQLRDTVVNAKSMGEWRSMMLTTYKGS